MRKYKCGNCGLVFNEDEADTRHENIGEFWGAPAYTDFVICPKCRSDELEEYTEPDEEEENE